ncbi:glycoside hydrolase family 43 protein [Pseudocercospora fijiensis CIRAD86]|uniref:Glycoside hydrolase family 43 protein n=1 Tax=Pseudocercospora fijiensis (strain CIRAD86) TaxID=383855 RepID=M3A3D6_PSEFD|nr:glycoside hydrolase family 43 protein [Pseudocercospora fijiensis CIRAD86]EME79156.1 glycoside hydrolase family 43 protein [Pseudocercospora fijiensis CIRAD86]
MMSAHKLISLGLLGSCLAQSSYPNSQSGSAGQITFTNSRRLLFDTNGDQIDAYGSKVNYINGSYYLYGNSFSTKSGAYGIKSYSSIDLENWQYNGFLFDPASANAAVCSEAGWCGRPHIVYNGKQYVLWADAGPNGYLVATSSSPSGPFTFSSERAAIDPQFSTLQPADFTTTIINNTGYIVFSALNFNEPTAGSIWPEISQTLHASELTSDLTNTTLKSYPVRSSEFDLIDQQAEAPDLFYREGWYYVAAANTCGYCNGTLALLYRSRSTQGPWTRQILAGYGCNGQVEGVLPLTDPNTKKTTYVWHATSVPGGPRTGFGGHIFQPLVFNADGSVQDLDCSDNAEFPVTFTKGTATIASSSAGDGSPAKAAYSPICDSDTFHLYQTWRAAKSGTIKSVAVNIAGAKVQTVPLALTVFKFSSHSDLLAPEYKWTAMGTKSVNGTDLSYVFDTVKVDITSNATVKAGDYLGLAMLGEDFTPYCHLEYANHDAGNVLYQRAPNPSSHQQRHISNSRSIMSKPTLTDRLGPWSVILQPSQNINRQNSHRTVPMQVLSLAPSRTGTLSMASAFKLLGYSNPYHFSSIFLNVRDCDIWIPALSAKFHRNEKIGRETFDQVLGHCSAVTDAPCIVFWEELIDAYPEAKILLVERDEEKWVKSCEGLTDGTFNFLLVYIFRFTDPFWLGKIIRTGLLWTAVFFGTCESQEAVMRNARRAYREHYREIREKVPKERILEYQLGSGWEPLCRFLEREVPEGVEFPHFNEAKTLELAFGALGQRALVNSLWNVGIVGLVVLGGYAAVSHRIQICHFFLQDGNDARIHLLLKLSIGQAPAVVVELAPDAPSDDACIRRARVVFDPSDQSVCGIEVAPRTFCNIFRPKQAMSASI